MRPEVAIAEADPLPADARHRLADLPATRAPRTGVAVAQAKLKIGSDFVTEESILHTDPKQPAVKRGIDKAISRRIRGLELKPLPVRKALAALASSASEHQFGSMREAIEQAIKMGRNGMDSDAMAAIDESEANAADAAAKVPATRNLPQKEMWRMVMDGKHQEARGKYGFENEKGYMKGMMGGFAHMLNTVHQPLSANLLEQLHDTAVGGVHERDGSKMEAGFRQNKDFGEAFGIDMDTWSPAGHDELLAKYRRRSENDEFVGGLLAQNPNKMLARSGDGSALQGRQEFKVRPLGPGEAKTLAEGVIGRYHGEIVKANQLAPGAVADAKLTAIARVCQDLDQMHLFADGNIRTIVFLVLNKLLIQEGMSPVVMHEPNVFDGKSVAELKKLIGAGQAKYQALAPAKKAPAKA